MVRTAMTDADTETKPLSPSTADDDQVKCAACGSNQMSANKKGFQLTRAAGAAYLLGPLGVLAGLIGSNTVVVTCLKCGNQWEPRKQKK
jgi:DNA-directed RNA polymerase subunit M/transcription elongation factor TFIIS